MKKLLITLIFVGFIFVSFFTKVEAKEENYSYKIIAKDNNISSLLELYKVKEEFIINYNNALNDNEKITKNYHTFSIYNVELIDNTFIIKIEEGNGICLQGRLKNNYCDNDTINYRIALLEWINNIK